ncbi:MAG: hypothetical protein QOE68_1857, partial [Thermoanaerobaculia bacterium]|nr:hypothetical protein [Thermoanaerobaculia bacterium]
NPAPRFARGRRLANDRAAAEAAATNFRQRVTCGDRLRGRKHIPQRYLPRAERGAGLFRAPSRATRLRFAETLRCANPFRGLRSVVRASSPASAAASRPAGVSVSINGSVLNPRHHRRRDARTTLFRDFPAREPFLRCRRGSAASRRTAPRAEDGTERRVRWPAMRTVRRRRCRRRRCRGGRL